jgi:hypothetical protein
MNSQCNLSTASHNQFNIHTFASKTIEQGKYEGGHKALSDVLTKSSDSGNAPAVNANLVTLTTALSKVATEGGGDYAMMVLFSSSFADREDLERTLEKLPVPPSGLTLTLTIL